MIFDAHRIKLNRAPINILMSIRENSTKLGGPILKHLKPLKYAKGIHSSKPPSDQKSGIEISKNGWKGIKKFN